MEKILCALCAAILLATACTKEIQQKEPEPFTLPDHASLTKSDVARILAELPLDSGHIREVHDAVSSSSDNGYDEEYMMSDIFNAPGSGVGDKGTTKSGNAYASPLRDLLTEYFNTHTGTKGPGETDAQDYIRALTESDLQIYWPFSEGWTGEFPIITFDPGYGAETNIGYEMVTDAGGGKSLREVLVDESVAMTRSVWVVNSNDDSAFTPLDFYKDDTRAGSDEETVNRHKLILKSFNLLRNFDSWFGGGSELMFKCGSASGFKATTMDDLKLYTPSVTDFMVMVRRSQIKKDVEINTILVTDFTEAIDKMAFLIIEDDGGTTTNWKCSATVKYQSKAYGFELDIPYKDKDDIVWRGQLSGDYFTEGEEVTGRFGDIIVTFALK